MGKDEDYQKYYNSNGLKNVFLPLYEISDIHARRWIIKAKHVVTLDINFLCNINRYDQVLKNDYTYQAFHDYNANCAVSDAFSTLYVFGILPET
jgi:hypothetical protein